MNNSLYSLFQTLNNVGIKYFLLTDFGCDLKTKDIDLFVTSDFKDLFEKKLIELRWYKRKEPSAHIHHHFYHSSDSEIYLDVKFELSFANGNKDCHTYLYSKEAILRSTLNCKGIYQPHILDAVILYAAHLAYKERGKLEKKHKDYLISYINAYKSVNVTLPCVIEEVTKWVKEDFPGNLYKLQKIVDSYFIHTRKKMIRSKRYLKYGFGFKVLFLGTDGSGKTTLIDEVINKINLKTRKLYLGSGENGWTSTLMKKIYNYEFKIKGVSNLYNFLKSYLILPFELFLRILTVKIKSKYSVVLIDRFPGTFIMDNRTIRRFIYNLVLPKPDLVFLLYADSTVLIKRKPGEITLDRSRADTIKFQIVAGIVSNSNYISIDTSNMTIAEARDLIISEIYKNSKVYDSLFITKHN